MPKEDNGAGAPKTKAEEDAEDFAKFEDGSSWDDGEEVDSRFEEGSDDDSAATDDSDDDASTSDDDVEEESEDSAEDEATSDEEEADEEAEEEDSEDDSAEDKKDSNAEEERKRHNKEMAEARIAEKKAREEAAKLRKQREDETLDRYVKEAGDDEIEREKRELDVQRYRQKLERIEFNEERLQTELDTAVDRIDLFRTGSDATKNELLEAIDDFEARFVVKDPNTGRPVQVKIDPRTGKRANILHHLQRKVDSIKAIQGDGAKDQGKAKDNQRRRTTTLPVRKPKSKKVDADLEAFDAEAKR